MFTAFVQDFLNGFKMTCFSRCRSASSTLVFLVLASCQMVLTQREQYVNHFQPYFGETPQNITTGPGDRARLRCQVNNLGTKTVVWRKSTQAHPLTIGLFTFVGDTRITVDYNQRIGEWTLVIQDVKPSDEGIYQCQISTKLERKKAYDVKLNVKTVQVSTSKFIHVGSPIHLLCNATGKPEAPHDVVWQKQGRNIDSDASNGILITKKIEGQMLVSVLVIEKSRKEHAGEYVCKSSNGDAGVVSVYFYNEKESPMQRLGDNGSTQPHRLDTSSATVTCSGFLTSLVAIVTIVIPQHRWLLDIR